MNVFAARSKQHMDRIAVLLIKHFIRVDLLLMDKHFLPYLFLAIL